MKWIQKKIEISPKSRGFHIITSEITQQLPEIQKFSKGIVHVFIQHTSASLTINESADPDVREDMESYFNRCVPENALYYRHTFEGPDDMAGHIKVSLLGCSISIPITEGCLNLA